MDSKKKKTLIIFIIFIGVLAAFLFFGNEPREDPADEDDQTKASAEAYQEGLTEQEQQEAEEDLASKTAYCYSSKVNGKNMYEELWLFWKSTNDYNYMCHIEDGDIREVSGHFWRDDDTLVYWMDGKEIQGKFEGDNLIIDGKTFEPLVEE